MWRRTDRIIMLIAVLGLGSRRHHRERQLALASAQQERPQNSMIGWSGIKRRIYTEPLVAGV